MTDNVEKSSGEEAYKYVPAFASYGEIDGLAVDMIDDEIFELAGTTRDAYEAALSHLRFCIEAMPEGARLFQAKFDNKKLGLNLSIWPSHKFHNARLDPSKDDTSSLNEQCWLVKGVSDAINALREVGYMNDLEPDKSWSEPKYREIVQLYERAKTERSTLKQQVAEKDDLIKKLMAKVDPSVLEAMGLQ